MKDPRSVLITGASGGIGQALARAYAAPGVALALAGRDPGRLEQAAEACRARGAAARTARIDVTDADAMARWIGEVNNETPLDLVIANAGVSAGTGGAAGEGDEQVRRIFAVNVDGVLNTILPAIPLMAGREPREGVRGQIAIMSSLAAFRGFPGAPAYSASKAAVKTYGEALRGTLKGHGVEVSVICPGFVKSPMTAANPYPMPFLIEADRAALLIKRRLARGGARIAFPLPLYALVWLIGALPPALTDPLLSRLPQKPPMV